MKRWFLILLVVFAPSGYLLADIQARQGVIDFKYWHLSPDGVFALKGEWLFYPGKLYQLRDLRNERLPEPVNFPVSLLDCKSLSDGLLPTQIPGSCVATYVLELRGLPEQPLALFIPEMATAFRLFWNEKEIAAGGVVSDNYQEFRTYSGHSRIDLPDTDTSGVLILQVANLQRVSPAPERNLLLGDAGAIHNFYSSGELIQALAGALSGIAGVLLFLQYLTRHRYERCLWSLSLFSFSVMMYTFTEGFNVLNWFIADPELHWPVSLRINLIALNLFVPCLAIWLHGYYRVSFPAWFLKVLWCQLLVIVPAFIWFPVAWLAALEPVQIMFNMISGVLLFIWLLQSPWYRSKESLAMIFTVAICILTGLHDSLVYLHFMRGDDWLHIGFTAFIIGQIFILAVTRARKHARIRRLNYNLELSKAMHQKRVDTRNKALMHKVSELETINDELQYLMKFDDLTGLLRQNVFMEDCEHRLRSSAVPGQVVSMLVLDIDRYKQISAQYGYLAADQTVKDIAGLLDQWAVGENYSVARSDSESFTLFALNMSEEEALQEAEWLRVRIQQKVITMPGLGNSAANFHVTASFGISCSLSEEAVSERLLKEAGLALNRAKMDGRNCVVSYSRMLNDRGYSSPDVTINDDTRL